MKVEKQTKITVTTEDGKKFYGEDAVAKAEAHEFNVRHGRLIKAWMEKHGMNARFEASTIATLSKWEADKASGVLDQLAAEAAEAAAAEAAAAAAAAEAAAAAAAEAAAAAAEAAPTGGEQPAE